MPERIHRPSPEQIQRPEARNTEHEKPLERPKRSERQAEDQPDLKEIQANIEQEATAAEQLNLGENAAGQAPSSLLVKQELKQTKFWHTLSSARKKLSLPDKLLSNVVHQPVVDAISNVGEKTIARPSGLLGGGLCAFIGSGTVLWFAKHYGFHYNYLLFFLLFAAGFLGGILAEIVFKLVRLRSQS